MRFAKLVLENFRSFGPGRTEIELPDEENLLALVGANNAGKSNLMVAIRLVLSTGRRYEPDPADFNRLDITSEMLIELHLREPLRRENIFRKEDEVWGFFLRAWQSIEHPTAGSSRRNTTASTPRGRRPAAHRRRPSRKRSADRDGRADGAPPT